MTTDWSDTAFAGLVPRPRQSVAEWADRYREIPFGRSPEPGPWRTSRVPYMREPMDAIADPAVEVVVCQWASQLGKTEFQTNIIGYFVDADPSAILLVHPNEGAMTSFSKERLEPTFRETPQLRGKLSDSLRDRDNTILVKLFPGGYLACAWATSPASLASRPIRVLLGDELDRWPENTGHDGDPWAQAVQRTSNFHNRKIVAISSPTVEGISRIARLYEDTDQRRFHVPCPNCGTFQVLAWEGVIYKREGAVDLDDVHYRCEHCRGRIEERDRPAMLALGEWKPDEPGRPHRGYQLSALYSPWVRWSELAAQWVKARADRDKRGTREFINLRLGEPWHEGGDRVDAAALEKNREEYDAEIPAGVVLLDAGVDVQGDRFEVEIVGWGAGKESWGIRYQIIPGDTAGAEAWAALDAFLTRTWTRADGTRLALHRAFIDSGHRTDEVYEFCRTRMPRVTAIKGTKAGPGAPVINDKPSIVGQRRAMIYLVGTHAAKDAIFSRLQLTEPGRGYCHFPSNAGTGYDSEYFRGLCSERRKARTRAGRSEMIWEKFYKRNEPLDCRCYATAAMELALLIDGVTLDRAPPPAAPAASATAPQQQPPSQVQQPAVRRRVLSRGIRIDGAR